VNTSILKVLLKLLGISVLLAILFRAFNMLSPAWVSTDVYLLIVFMLILNGGTAIANIWAHKNNYLVTIFTASQVIRMLVCIGILYFLISSNPSEANALVVNFFIIYLVFLIFEISTLLSNLRAEFRKPE